MVVSSIFATDIPVGQSKRTLSFYGSLQLLSNVFDMVLYTTVVYSLVELKHLGTKLAHKKSMKFTRLYRLLNAFY